MLSIKNLYLQREAEYMELARRYERCPEDQQKAAGAAEAREQAAYYHDMAERESAEE